MTEGRRSARLALGWLAYLSFIVYGSLVPFDFHALTLDQAWERLRNAPMLQIGVEGRADWIANGVLYVPAGFLSAALFVHGHRLPSRILMAIGAGLFCFALAAGVEFTQTFFPPRTVSLNDVIAECVGSLLGIVLAFRWSGWFHRLLGALAGRLDQAVTYGLQAYAVVYLAFSLFPFDILLSSDELAEKLRSNTWGWLVAGQSLERGPVILLVKMLAEAIAVVPIGLMIGRWNESRRKPATLFAMAGGLVLGLVLETAQFFLFSGISQGVSLLTRAIGSLMGAELWRRRAVLPDALKSSWRGRSAAIVLPLYLIGLAAVNGWFDSPWLGLAHAARSIAQTSFVPFYYHYFTSEQAALRSLAAAAVMYSPAGAMAWISRWRRSFAIAAAALVALAMETGKLFLAGKHADPTNVLIAGVAAWAMLIVLERMTGRSTPSPGPANPYVQGLTHVVPATTPEAPVDGAVRPRQPLAIVAVLAVAAWAAVDFPAWPMIVSTGLLGYAALLWNRPQFMWLALPLALPLLDFAPWSGHFYFDEFDYLVLVSLVVGFARTQPASGDRDKWLATIGVLLAITFAVGTFRGLLPWQWPDVNSFSSYYSPYNALREAKGVLWALLLAILLRRFPTNTSHRFAVGNVVGLAGTVAVVMWERAAFPGLLNVADVYRVTGPFSQMHTGGADIEAYLTAAVPFAVLMLIEARAWWLRAGVILVILGATYVLMVTFSRAGYLAYAVAVGLALVFAVRSHLDGRLWRWVAPAAVVMAALVVAVPIYLGSFAQERISRTGTDFTARATHWRDALAIRDPGLATDFFGMGLGRFPETHYWRSAERRAGGYRLVREGDNVFLRLGGGLPLYIEQIVGTASNQKYVLRFSIRGAKSDAGIRFSLCEKWLLTSAQCVFESATIDQPGNWQTHSIQIFSGLVGAGGFVRPVKLSLYNPSDSRAVDVDNVELRDADGRQLITNGDFARGMDHWFFTADQDPPWHIWSMPVALLFDLGWLGLTSFSIAMLLGVAGHARRAMRGDTLSAASLAALAGVLVLAGVDTIVDAPRLQLLLLWILLSNRNPLDRPEWWRPLETKCH